MSHGSAPSLGGARPQINRPSPQVNRPQVNRPQVNRPAPSAPRPNLGSQNINRPGGGGPNLGGVNRPSRPNTGVSQRPAGGLKPNLGNLPSGGAKLPTGGARPAQRPNVSIPNLANKLPQNPGGAQNPGVAQRPSLPNRPGGATALPGGGIANRPGGANKLPGSGAQVNRPNLPGGGGTLPGGRPTTRPATRPGGRPSEGNLDDFLGIQRPDRPTTLPAVRPGGSRLGVDRPTTLPGRPDDRPGWPLPNRPGRPGQPNRPGQRPDLPDWVTRPGEPGGSWRPGGDNGAIHRPPNWANRPGAGNIGDRWENAVTRPGAGMSNWLDRHPSRNARWNYWGSNVRHSWGHYHNHGDWFGPNWWNGHYHNLGGWHYHYCNRNYAWSYWWSVPVWANLNQWFVWSTPSGYWNQPYYYDYGNGGNVYYEDNRVYVDGQDVGTTADFAASAAELATVAPPESEEEAESTEWMALGTFAVSSDEKDTKPSRTVQLAVNKQGVVSGTLYNEQTDEAQTILGQVDKETQRVAMRIGESDQFVIETGLYNLTQDECPVMVHYGTDKIEYWLLVRLEYEGDDDSQ